MPNSRFGYSVKKNSFKGLNIDCIQYSNIIRITHYSYSYSGTILNPNIIRIRIRPNICARILFVFVFAHSEKTNIIRIRIRSKFWFRILFVFVFGPKNSIRSPLDPMLKNPTRWALFITCSLSCLLVATAVVWEGNRFGRCVTRKPNYFRIKIKNLPLDLQNVLLD